MTTQNKQQEMIQFGAFKKELQGLLDKVLDEAKKIQITAADPVSLDQTWILNKFEAQMTQKEYTLEPKAFQVARGLGNLQKLPRELRDKIYSHAIANGTTAIARASKQTKAEVSKLIFKTGIYRLSLGFNEDDLNPRLSRTLAKKIQNVKIRVNSRAPFIRGLAPHMPKLHKFDGPFVQRRECAVMIECDPFAGNLEAWQVVPALTDFVGFERVVLELDLDWYGDAWPDTVEEFENDRIKARINGALSYQKEKLEPSLGDARVCLDEGRYRLVFHPRK